MRSPRWLAVCFVAFSLWTGSLCRSAAQSAQDVPLHALYETRVKSKTGELETRRWAFNRSDAALEYHDYASAITERWRRDVRSNVSFVRMFHREQAAVRYMAGDLAALGVTPDWSQLLHVLRPPSAEHFKGGELTHWLGERAQVYRRSNGASRVKIVWLCDLGIPGAVSVRSPGFSVSLKLLELSLQRPDLTVLPRRQVDITDFGDMEQDPFVRRHHNTALPGASLLAKLIER